MSKKNGFSMLETIIPMVRLFPPARLRAWRLGWYFNSSIALITRARVDVLTTLALLSTRETVAVETLARRATCSRFMSLILYKISQDWEPARAGGVVIAITWLIAGAIVLPIAAPGEFPSTRRRLPAGDGRGLPRSWCRRSSDVSGFRFVLRQRCGRDTRRRPRGRSGSAAWRDVRRHPRSDERSPHPT